MVLAAILVASSVYHLPALSAEQLKARCATVHGKFYTREQSGAYECDFAKGLVTCDAAGRCTGHAKHHGDEYSARIVPRHDQFG